MNEQWLRRYVDQIAAYPILGALEEAELARQAASGCVLARERMICCNLRLSLKIALSYFRMCNGSLPDLVSEGSKGLARAVDLFDPNRGTRFSTYACWWIRQSIRRWIDDHTYTVRITRHHKEKLRGRMREHREKGGQFEDFDFQPMVPIMRSIHEQNEGRGEEGSFEDSLLDPAAVSPREQVTWKDSREKMLTELDRLPGNQGKVLRLRYGIGCQPMNLRQIGTACGLSRDHVRQLYQVALSALRKSLGEPIPGERK